MAETFRQEYTRCNRQGCKKCPHGPYWYAYWREGKRLRKRYVGKKLPPPPEPSEQSYNRLDDIFNDRMASSGLAHEILGLELWCARDVAVRRYRELSLLHHPDRGGDPLTFKRIAAAFSWLDRFAWD